MCRKEAWVMEALSKYVTIQRIECWCKKYIHAPTRLTLSSAFVYRFIILLSPLQTYCCSACLPICRAWSLKVRMPDAHCLTRCLVTSWVLVGRHVPLSALAFNSSPCSLDPNASSSEYQWCWTHPLTRGSHWLTADVTPMLLSNMGVAETKDDGCLGVRVGSVFHFSLSLNLWYVNDTWEVEWACWWGRRLKQDSWEETHCEEFGACVNKMH